MAVSLPTPRDTRFWNRIAPRYAKGPISDQASYERKLRETAALMRPDMKVLEIGCGTGSTALHHAPNVAEIYATDLSAGMLDIARDKAAAAGAGNVTFARHAAEDIPADWGPFDMIMAHSILHLVADPQAVMQEMARRLKPGGTFVTSTVCMSDGMNWFKVIARPGYALGLLPRVTFFSADDLRGWMSGAGLDIHTEWRPGPRKAVFMIGHKSE